MPVFICISDLFSRHNWLPWKPFAIYCTYIFSVWGIATCWQMYECAAVILIWTFGHCYTVHCCHWLLLLIVFVHPILLLCRQDRQQRITFHFKTDAVGSHWSLQTCIEHFRSNNRKSWERTTNKTFSCGSELLLHKGVATKCPFNHKASIYELGSKNEGNTFWY